jgi:aspartate/methionine/tyrosine aminotransferase
LYELLKKKGFVLEKPQGAYYMITDISALMQKMGATNDTDFCKKMINKIGVAAVPGSSFYSDAKKGVNFIRFCFCKKSETLHSVEKAFQLL